MIKGIQELLHIRMLKQQDLVSTGRPEGRREAPQSPKMGREGPNSVSTRIPSLG